MDSFINYHVYRNLHRKLWSVKYRGKVINHAHWLLLENPAGTGAAWFKVNPGGRDRVIKEQRKNVHAYGVGLSVCYDTHIIHTEMGVHKDALVQVTYNPYKHGFFYRVDNEQPVAFADKIYFTPSGVFVLNPRV